ncbi:hypothetical protein AAGU66_14455 [Edwardsiella ictaluri]|uniref:Uncharacterized protein n=1 Tax=Edwardsiella ictaluri (strain 93-146) TaxID=634503 RepID=C5B932_EDWI9|nr:hypothetical protein [Edwardsiella ictaluri]ACR70460.2 hypothetical protein NT01EI_3321 [Edwardsiella ictaluri 93-146]UCQ47326.1 hypothetical protein DB741_15270 [Edwardsiella ictaluri]UCQ50590.1 hypothetical protein DB731_15250 [Edwardsiella ictaluri]UYB61240.1 hypothetical protein N8I66_14940 [Edwardsiella ictaluri]UYB64467.1 hypothetical protein N8I67_14935 [Edwardsiella ictaluri]
MLTNAAIGVGVNTVVQLSGDDPFSYVDASIAGLISASTTGKGWQASAAINMGGAAVGSALKGEDPTNAVIGAGIGSVVGSIGGKAIDLLPPVKNKTAKNIIGATTSSTLTEMTGGVVKDNLDQSNNDDN